MSWSRRGGALGNHCRTGNTRRGFTVIEFVVASGLLLTALVSAGLGISSARRTIAEARVKDEAQLRAYTILESTAALGCQRITDPADVRLAILEQRCAEAVGVTDLDGVHAAGDFQAELTSSTGTFDVTLASRFLDAGSSSCKASSSSVPSLIGGPPELLERSVTITWTSKNRPRSRTFRTLETVTASQMSQAGAVWVDAPAGTLVTLQLPDGSGSITRFAVDCPDSTPGGRASFPSLKPGTYQVLGNTQTVTAIVTNAIGQVTL